MDARKVIRWAINIIALVAAIAALPEFGAVVPAAYLPAIMGAVAIINKILSLIRSLNAGEPILGKSF